MGRDYQPALPGVTRYTRWGQVPEGLFTRTQLGGLTPPRKPAPGAGPQGQVLYHGNCYAPLYALADTVTKRPVSPAQRAALDRARALRRVCRLCGDHDDAPLGKGRVCDRCEAVRDAHRRHLQARQAAEAVNDLLVERGAVLVAVDDPDRIRQVAVGGLGFHLALDVVVPGDERPAAGALPPAEAFAVLTEHLARYVTGVPRVVCWAERWWLRVGLLRLLVAELPYPPYTGWDAEADRVREATLAEANRRAEPYPWLHTPRWTDIHHTYARWYAQPAPSSGLDPLGFHPDWGVGLPGATGDAAQDVTAVWAALHTAAFGDERAVSPRAPWVTHPAAVSDLVPDPDPTDMGVA